ncbi:MAG: hypothetical protein K6E47_09975 [Lachnospiraceae bacterium]|nr:hypothetical protein [Lachnospiraceae bacterium]
MLNVTSQFLDENTLFRFRLTDISDNMNQEEERELANHYVYAFQDVFNERGLATQVQGDWAQCGNTIHPLLRFNSLKNYGSIGLLINRSLLAVLFLSFGQAYQLKIRKEELSNSAQHLNEKLTSWGNYSSGYGMDNVFGLVSQTKDMKRAKQYAAEAESIQYDPTELMWEEEWVRDISSVIKDMFDVQ